MKKTALTFLLSLLIMGTSTAQTIQLPKPEMTLKTTLMEALAQRRSERNYSDKEIPLQQLSNLLWAANGINRSNGKRTAPSAINAQDIDIYVAGEKGAYYYNVQANTLEFITAEDLRPAAANGQDFVMQAPIVLILVTDAAKFRNPGAAKFGDMDAGYVSQNICLYCAAAGLATVPRAIMDADALKDGLKLKETQRVCLNSPIGYPEE